MVRLVLVDRNQHKKWCCVAETSADVHICKIYSALEKVSPRFSWYGQRPTIYQLKACGC